jgi:hypothetical protein
MMTEYEKMDMRHLADVLDRLGIVSRIATNDEWVPITWEHAEQIVIVLRAEGWTIAPPKP